MERERERSKGGKQREERERGSEHGDTNDTRQSERSRGTCKLVLITFCVMSLLPFHIVEDKRLIQDSHVSETKKVSKYVNYSHFLHTVLHSVERASLNYLGGCTFFHYYFFHFLGSQLVFNLLLVFP